MTSRDKGMLAGGVCFGVLMAPWAFFGYLLVLTAEGRTAWTWLIWLLGAFIIACVSALLGLGVARGSRKLIVLSSVLVTAVIGGLIYVYLPMFLEP